MCILAIEPRVVPRRCMFAIMLDVTKAEEFSEDELKLRLNIMGRDLYFNGLFKRILCEYWLLSLALVFACCSCLTISKLKSSLKTT